MKVYRVGKKQYSSDLLGEGARLFGGRWNSIGTPCLYTSESRALALLEFSVNIQISDISNTLCFTVIEIPDDEILEVDLENLPENWNSFPVSSSTRLFGNELLTNCEKPIIKIPSTIITKEWNYLLNPKYNNSNNFKIIEIEDYVYDVRIKKS
jgi:RES domain-containing protein